MGLEVGLLQIIGLGIAGAGYVQQASASKKLATAQKRQSALEAQRARLKTIREARIKRAQIASAAASQGVGQSSGAIGGGGSVLSQASAGLGYIGQQESIQSDIFSAKSAASTGAGLTGLGGTLFSNAKRISSIFD